MGRCAWQMFWVYLFLGAAVGANAALDITADWAGTDPSSAYAGRNLHNNRAALPHGIRIPAYLAHVFLYFFHVSHVPMHQLCRH
jgi:hypothetical protein